MGAINIVHAFVIAIVAISWLCELCFYKVEKKRDSNV
jgi:hypothetical protein